MAIITISYFFIVALIHYFNRVIFFVLIVLTGGYAFAGHPEAPAINQNPHPENNEQIAKEAFIYALLSVNAYETLDNTPFVLPACIKEVRHEDSRLSDPSPKYVHSNVYDKGSFQAKIFELNKKRRRQANCPGGPLFLHVKLLEPDQSNGLF